MARIRGVTTCRQIPLQDNWQLISVAPDSYQSPEQLKHLENGWLSASVPSTVAVTLQQHQQWDLSHPLNIDATDWWYRCSFDALLPEHTEHSRKIVLVFGGLTTIADVWLNGQHILRADNMFFSYKVDITYLLNKYNKLYIRFSSLQSLLSTKRPRPRWRTQLVSNQQLRWFRTTLLGRMPGWTPPIQPVGPWRPVWIEEHTLLAIELLYLQTTFKDNCGYISLRLHAQSLVEDLPAEASLVVGDMTFPLHIQQQVASDFVLAGEVSLPSVQAWWPHTHGNQPLYATKIILQWSKATIEVDCGQLAFRHVELLQDVSDDFGLCLNDVPIFCRGACWTPLDIASLTGTKQAYTETLQMVQGAGMNMLRIGGTMVYEADIFYDLCDELGILVWQDFMFANMDYPIIDEVFRLNCIKECKQQLERLQTHPCLALFCGNSEIEQQAAMLGLPAKMWKNDFFYQQLPELCGHYTDVPYWPSSPSGGTHPFQSNRGNAHYQGVGPFLRPLEDARRSEVRFATECLGFANVPEDQTLDLFLKPGEVAPHHPNWKARSPRDYATGWDFDDIRDYYLELLFHTNAMKLRYSDMQRYLELSRVTSGEVMSYVFAEWRRQRSTCHGALVWFCRDLWPGAGWGIIDSTGYPKAAYYYLKRVLLPQACFFSDEGLNGLYLHIVNDTVIPTSTEVLLSLYRLPGTLMATVTKEFSLSSHEEREIHVDGLFEGFKDLTYAYRFGPCGHHVIVASVIYRKGANSLPRRSEAFYFPQGLPATRDTDIGLSAQATLCLDGTYELHIHTEKFAQSIAIRAENYLAEDNYFHLQPEYERTILLYPKEQFSIFRCSISALNTYQEVEIEIETGKGSSLVNKQGK